MKFAQLFPTELNAGLLILQYLLMLRHGHAGAIIHRDVSQPAETGAGACRLWREVNPRMFVCDTLS